MSRRLLWVSLLFTLLLLAALTYRLLLESPPSPRTTLETLRSLPYASWTPVEEGDPAGGVTLWDRDRAQPGLNLYSFETSPGGYLADLSGEVLLELRDPRPEPTVWKLVEPWGEDAFAVLVAGSEILGVDRDSRLLWRRSGGFHHDFDLAPDGSLWGFSRERERVPALNRWKPIWNDHLVHLARDGSELRRISSADLLLETPALEAVRATRSSPLLDWTDDVFHANTITEIPRRVRYETGLTFEPGDLLLCWRNLNLVLVVDPEKPAVRWHWGATDLDWPLDWSLDWPHHPSLLENGNILLFDNGTHRGWSRILELDPATNDVVWTYQADPPESFFSSSRGSVQRLPNGNTLITDSGSARVFEITPSGDPVWSWTTPLTRQTWRGPERATIYRMTRLPLPTPSATLPPHPADKLHGPAI